MINFNVPPFVGPEIEYIKDAIEKRKICGDGMFTIKCNELIEEITGTKKALLTTSCTHALEMAAILCDIEPDDEVIMPSYTFVSTANAFALRGARIVFVDIRPDTMNINEELIEEAITEKTKAIVPVHYAGVSCEMNKIMELAGKHSLYVVEDAAQGIGSSYHDKPLGAIGDIGTFSFHETKNLSCGEGGAFLTNRNDLVERAEIIREKGTNRNQFFRGEVDKYSWCDIGSSYLPSELNAAYLLAQLENMNIINNNRLESWNYYEETLKELVNEEKIEIPTIPWHCIHNGHMFWLKASDLEERTRLLNYLKDNGVYAVFHYVPLHSSLAGKSLGRFFGEDVYTTKESERLIRLPLYYGLTPTEREKVVDYVYRFYN
jgi:dTDP-4-amino-4,6-dideoxygalactose transaminase